jgi:hypothetical protein
LIAILRYPCGVKIIACVALALFVAGCVPIGLRTSNMYAQVSSDEALRTGLVPARR